MRKESKIFLIDNENIGSAWIQLFPIVHKGDMIYVFYSENSSKISLEEVESLKENSNLYCIEKCYIGENAMDFQLVSYLGFLAKTREKTKFYIVSKDKGYNPVTRFWHERNRNVARFSVDEIQRLHKISLDNEKTSASIFKMRQICGEMDINELETNYLRFLQGKNLNDVYKELIKTYGEMNGRYFYQNFKKYIKQECSQNKEENKNENGNDDEKKSELKGSNNIEKHLKLNALVGNLSS